MHSVRVEYGIIERASKHVLSLAVCTLLGFLMVEVSPRLAVCSFPFFSSLLGGGLM